MSIALSLALLAGTAVSPWSEATGPFRIDTVGPATLRVSGLIRPGDAAVLERYLTREVRRVIVNSAGGEAATALAMAGMVEARGLSIIVDGVCASSCANYLFAAAAQRTVQPGALVLWHGAPDAASRTDLHAQLRTAMNGAGATPAEVATTIAREDARLDSWIAAQDALYARRGLSRSVLYRLNDPVLGPPVPRHVPGSAGSTDMLHLSAAALHCAGFATTAAANTTPIDVAARRIGVTGVRIVALPNLERVLCQPRR